MKNIAVFLFIVGVASTAPAAPSFFVAPNSYPSSGSDNDLAWQAAVGSFSEWDYDSSTAGWYLVSMGAGTTSISATLGGLGGESGHPEIFAGAWGGAAAGSVYGTVFDNALLNRDEVGAVHSDFVFTFNEPVAGVGAWLYDDGSGTAESMILQVTEAGGATSTSGLLESGNGLNHFVEGFLGATSNVGITQARFIVTDGQGKPVQRVFELDHFQAGGPISTTVPAPGALLLGGLGASLVSFLRRRRSL